ncbi:MAG: PEP-CTERM sorting domain-containing protein [Roseiarcus sp.]|jgi:hypothetical protein
MLKVLGLGVVAAISMGASANAQLFGGGFGGNTLGPEFVITFAANGAITTTLNSVYTLDPGPYDGSDDTYIGVINDTGHSISSFGLSSSQDIGGFDGDGIDAYGAPGNAMDTTGYGGVDAYFTNNTIDALTVNFIGGIPGGGGQGYFSLEEPVSLSAPPVVTPGVPEASTWVMMAFGFAGLGLAGYRKAKAPKALSAA